jgi:hypothetical protein
MKRGVHGFIAAVGVACVAVLLWATFASRGASVRPDELGFLLNGWVLTGHKEALFGVDFRSFYTAGYGLITAGAALVGRNMNAQYRISLIANIGMVMATAAALARLGFRHLALSRRMARSIAIIIAAMPAVAANALFAWSESLNRLAFVVISLLAFEHVTRPRFATAGSIGLAASFMAIAHGRFTLIPLLAVIFLVLACLPVPRRNLPLALFGIAVTVIGWLVFTRLNVSLRNDLYPASAGKEGRMFDKLTNTSNLNSLARSATGQLWYVLATSFGLAGVGLVMNIRSIILGRRRFFNIQWLAPLFVLVSAGTVALASSLQILQVIRPDHLVYGRYLEAVSPVFVLFGICGVLTGSKFAKRAWLSSITTIALCAAGLTVAAREDKLHAMLSERKFFAIPNALALDFAIRATRPSGYLSLTIVFVVAALALYTLNRRRPAAFVLLLAVLSLAATTATAVKTVVPYRDYFDQIVLDDAVRRSSEHDSRITHVMFDAGGLGGQTYFDYRYLLHPIQIDRADVHWIDRSHLRCVIGAFDRPPEDTGWSIVAKENDAASRTKQPRGNIVLWKRTGVDSC